MSQPDRLTCEEVFARLDDYLDRELSPADIQRVEDHLKACAACASEHRFEAHVLEDVKAKMRRIAMPPALQSEVLRRLARDLGSG